ncbi:hypothetical protein [Martelella sp. HB161492]|nr:hypothetical protein [Martelella sp. HB161492]
MKEQIENNDILENEVMDDIREELRKNVEAYLESHVLEANPSNMIIHQ